ncbi:MAG: hypothetical protein K9N23_08000 [Akkermansiaceae bacterium]|nr:hypothetical protein [Akkermansiaceae bacterium]MCF7731615.1 hypothetical protein [Akkermansiaceae bacterium]
MRFTTIVRTCVALTVVWSAVWAVRWIAGSLKTTAAGVERRIETAGFADGAAQVVADPALAATRDQSLREIASMINRLDHQERAEYRRRGTARRLFEQLSPAEQEVFVELAVTPALDSLLDSLESLPAKQRKRFIEQGVKALTATNDAGLQPATGYQQPLKLLENLDIKDLRALLKGAGPRLKFQVSPLVEAINESLQGMNGPEFGPRRQH